MSNTPSLSQLINFCLSYKFFPFIPFIADVVLPSSLQPMFVLGANSSHPFFIFDIFSVLFFFIAVSKNKINKVKPDLILLIGIYFLFAIGSSLINNPGRFFADLHYCLDFISYAFLFRFAIYNKTEISILFVIFRFFIIFLSLQIFLGFFGFVDIGSVDDFGLVRVGTTAGSTNMTSHLLFLLCVISLFGLEKKTSIILLLVVTGLAIFFTLCRGAILAFVLYIACYILYVLKNKHFFAKIGFAVFAVGLLFSLNYYFHLSELLEARQEASMAFSGGTDYTAGRTERWEKVFKALDKNDSYLFGEGLATTPMNRGELYSPKKIEEKTFSPHNVYIGVLCETGIITLLIFILILCITLKRFYKIDKVLFFGILSFYGVTYMTEIVGYTLDFSVLLWFAYYNFYNRDSLIAARESA